MSRARLRYFASTSSSCWLSTAICTSLLSETPLMLLTCRAYSSLAKVSVEAVVSNLEISSSFSFTSASICSNLFSMSSSLAWACSSRGSFRSAAASSCFCRVCSCCCSCATAVSSDFDSSSTFFFSSVKDETRSTITDCCSLLSSATFDCWSMVSSSFATKVCMPSSSASFSALASCSACKALSNFRTSTPTGPFSWTSAKAVSNLLRCSSSILLMFACCSSMSSSFAICIRMRTTSSSFSSARFRSNTSCCTSSAPWRSPALSVRAKLAKPLSQLAAWRSGRVRGAVFAPAPFPRKLAKMLMAVRAAAHSHYQCGYSKQQPSKILVC
mmetsp:Transcript_42956/g.98644  ORF Transcript_42956/g.98644 Transcript_42956/m.98644 type:complete len:328 (+) Transcript_42956:1557-2540(+)